MVKGESPAARWKILCSGQGLNTCLSLEFCYLSQYCTLVFIHSVGDEAMMSIDTYMNTIEMAMLPFLSMGMGRSSKKCRNLCSILSSFWGGLDTMLPVPRRMPYSEQWGQGQSPPFLLKHGAATDATVMELEGERAWGDVSLQPHEEQSSWRSPSCPTSAFTWASAAVAQLQMEVCRTYEGSGCALKLVILS